MVRGRQFLLFLVTGGMAALANMGSRYLFNMVWPYAISIILAYGVGMATAFALFKVFVFEARHSSRTARESVWFVLVNIVALLQTLVISLILADYFFPWLEFQWHPHDAAHVIGVLVPVVTSFFGHKFLTFKKVEPCV